MAIRLIQLGGRLLIVVRDPYEERLLEEILVRLRQMNDARDERKEGARHVS